MGHCMCLRNNGEAHVAGLEQEREDEAEEEVGKAARPKREGLGGQGFYSEPDEKPPEGLSRGGAGSDSRVSQAPSGWLGVENRLRV